MATRRKPVNYSIGGIPSASSSQISLPSPQKPPLANSSSINISQAPREVSVSQERSLSLTAPVKPPISNLEKPRISIQPIRQVSQPSIGAKEPAKTTVPNDTRPGPNEAQKLERKQTMGSLSLQKQLNSIKQAKEDAKRPEQVVQPQTTPTPVSQEIDNQNDEKVVKMQEELKQQLSFTSKLVEKLTENNIPVPELPIDLQEEVKRAMKSLEDELDKILGDSVKEVESWGNRMNGLTQQVKTSLNLPVAVYSKKEETSAMKKEKEKVEVVEEKQVDKEPLEEKPTTFSAMLKNTMLSKTDTKTSESQENAVLKSEDLKGTQAFVPALSSVANENASIIADIRLEINEKSNESDKSPELPVVSEFAAINDQTPEESLQKPSLPQLDSAVDVKALDKPIDMGSFSEDFEKDVLSIFSSFGF